jgi:hypothetical protein
MVLDMDSTEIASATIFALGIMMLAKSTISDSGHPVGDHSSTTPCKMVSESAPRSWSIESQSQNENSG